MLSALHPLPPIGPPHDRQAPVFRRHDGLPQQAQRPRPYPLTQAPSPDTSDTPPPDVKAAAPSGQATPPKTPSTPALSPAIPPPPPPMDPRFMAMATRIASYYQQRCQAITTAQQQRCQAWATMQRQKTQEMMHSAMLVVAWYVRDRIQRKRRRQRRKFRSGLQEAQASRVRLSNSELVRRWAVQIPDRLTSPHVLLPEELKDREEAAFEMDGRARAAARDKDAKLLEIAERMVRSQSKTKVDVPIFGSLSYDDVVMGSDTDSDVGRDEPDFVVADYPEDLRQGVQELELAEEGEDAAEDEDADADVDAEGEEEDLDDDDDDEDDDEDLEDYEYDEETGDEEPAMHGPAVNLEKGVRGELVTSNATGTAKTTVATGSPRLEN